eukprot:scaffold375784_cov17-Prasinocladus_malaysianus.AAC.2
MFHFIYRHFNSFAFRTFHSQPNLYFFSIIYCFSKNCAVRLKRQGQRDTFGLAHQARAVESEAAELFGRASARAARAATSEYSPRSDPTVAILRPPEHTSAPPLRLAKGPVGTEAAEGIREPWPPRGSCRRDNCEAEASLRSRLWRQATD